MSPHCTPIPARLACSRTPYRARAHTHTPDVSVPFVFASQCALNPARPTKKIKPEPSKATGPGGDTCRVCGKEGHKSFQCPDKKSAAPAASRATAPGGTVFGPNQCRVCGEEGHKSFACPQKQKQSEAKAEAKTYGPNQCRVCGEVRVRVCACVHVCVHTCA